MRQRTTSTIKTHTLSKKHKRWWVILPLFLALICTVVWFLQRRPQQIECLTEINTVCPAEMTQELMVLKQTPSWKQAVVFRKVREQLLQQYPEIVSVGLESSRLQSVKIRIELGKPLFPVLLHSQFYWMLSNGYLQPSDESSFPLLSFSDEDWLYQLSPTERRSIGSFYQKLQNFSPRIRKIVIVSLQEIEVYPENRGKVLFSAEEVDRQLATLQAFLRSTTMNQAYRTLDVRFTDAAVIKEQ